MDRVETHIGTVGYRRAGVGVPLVLLHGGLSDGRSWAPQLESLAHNYDVVAWDAPGCGGSADPVAGLRLADYADAVAALVRALGLSGAYAGWRGSLPPAEVEARLNRALAELDRPPAEWVDSYLAGFFGRSVARETVEAARAMMLDVRPAGALSMLTAFATADLRAVLPTVAVPTLLIYGAQDVRAPRGVAEAMHAAIPGSRLILVPAAGHDVNLEAPQEYDAAVRAFLQMADEPAEPQNR